MSTPVNDHQIGALVGIIGLLTGWSREAWRWLDTLKKKAASTEIDERRVMIEEFKAFREAYHDDKADQTDRIAALESRLEDADMRAAGFRDKLAERTLQYKDALKRIEELLVRIAELEKVIGERAR